MPASYKYFVTCIYKFIFPLTFRKCVDNYYPEKLSNISPQIISDFIQNYSKNRQISHKNLHVIALYATA